MANLLSTNVTGTLNSTGNTTAAGFTGNANVGGTGAATWHPSGIYSGGTEWLYGTMYRNGSATYGQANLYFDNNYGYGMVGLYSAERYQAVFAMGDSYKLPADGTGPGSLYGIAWTHTNVGGESKAGLGHQALFMMNGRTYTAIGSGIWTDGTITTTSHGTSANWNTAYGWGNHASAGYQAASTAITTSNIGSQSVNYASSAGNADTVDSYHAASFFRDLGFEGGGANANTIAETRSAFTYASGAPYSGPLAYFGASGYGLQFNATYQVGTSLAYRTRNGDNGTWNTWRAIIHDGNIGSQSVNYASSAGNADTVDSYHASNFLGKNGNSYYQQDTWIQSTGTHGLYAPSSGSGTHWYPGTNATYGTWIMEGMRNNYQGIQFYNAAGPIVVMYDSSGNGGAYNHSDWHFYWNNGNRCLGVNGSSTSSSYALYVNTKGIYTDGDVVAFSDRRKKSDIVTIDNALEKVSQMRGVYYTRIDDENGPRKTGVIAQEMNEILPEVVSYAADTDEYGVSYGNIVGVLIEAIKEQQKQIDELKKRLGE
jgi:hypothetical protein